MWRFKPFMQKEAAGLEGRSMDVGNLKIHIRNVIAEGGFSCVYLARDTLHVSKQYALKHIICNDDESLDLVMKEISVMKSLRGHPNIVTLYAHTILDMGRTKEAFLVMEFCEKSLVSVLDSRGSGYFDEKQVLAMFRDMCNAIFAMHCQSPPIAHRDLKAENLLLGPDGLWKLCDFGSTSTNHKRFEKPEEMGIEEDNIRKHTTPAYRAPEMWDLFRRELINEKVDIWALGCLLFRICYFKSAFDGESKLQILNGNYRIPELPKYSSTITDLIKDLLQSSPDDRPDITQASALLDWPFISINLGVVSSGNSRLPSNKSPSMPRRSPPPPPSTLEPSRDSSHQPTSKAGGGAGQLGAFWSSQHAKESLVDKSEPKFDEEPTSHSMAKHDKFRADNQLLSKNIVHGKEDTTTQSQNVGRNSYGRSKPEDGSSKDFELSFFQKDRDHHVERSKASNTGSLESFRDNSFNTFVAEFDTRKLSPEAGINKKSSKEEALEAELEKLKEQLVQVNSEKAEMTSKFEKLSAICRSQRQELQELKQALAAKTPSPNKDVSRNQISPGIRPSGAPLLRDGAIRELQQEKDNRSTVSPEAKMWQPFAEETKSQQPLSASKSVRTRNGQQNMPPTQVNSGFESWGFGTDNFTAAPTGSSQMSRPFGDGNNSQRSGEAKMMENKAASQPAGWAGF
ncbi:hypothetical protein F8388_005700 [Cannabis sativa]|uniref:non-specific serine/threonine protein kinase n=1 Tax=Cannabis sativa TaxID=3483 RepID=A0A7J6H6I1_CANSA|nr:hypothetical protein F8388_005700 [Cannabis sativa]